MENFFILNEMQFSDQGRGRGLPTGKCSERSCDNNTMIIRHGIHYKKIELDNLSFFKKVLINDFSQSISQSFIRKCMCNNE